MPSSNTLATVQFWSVGECDGPGRRGSDLDMSRNVFESDPKAGVFSTKKVVPEDKPGCVIAS
jgi:hypothetical protein